MASGLIEIMKRAAQEAESTAQPTDLKYGEVTGVNPLKIFITNLFTVPESVLIVPEHLTDYEIKVTTSGYGWETEEESGGSGEEAFEAHKHKIDQTKKTIKVHGALKVGDKVALLRARGGQSFYVLDRLPKE